MTDSATDLAWHDDGTPYSPRYGDVYCTRSGPDQASRVFVDGNSLPERFAEGRAFTVLEIGFGLGLNFLATWNAWLAGGAPGVLRYVGVEGHPLTPTELGNALARLDSDPQHAAALAAAWPATGSAGRHALLGSSGEPRLELVIGDVEPALATLDVVPDAIYLDGFSPATNSAMWTPAVFRALATLARPGTTLATYSVASEVRLGLASSGFAVDKRPGYGAKRHMLGGHFPG